MGYEPDKTSNSSSTAEYVKYQKQEKNINSYVFFSREGFDRRKQIRIIFGIIIVLILITAIAIPTIIIVIGKRKLPQPTLYG